MGLFSFLGKIPFLGDALDAANSRQAAKIDRNWQERMSNTSMQRRVADLQAAGLNPMLAGLNQQGADSPSGSMAAPSHFGSGQASMRANELQRKAIDSSIGLQEAQAASARANARLQDATAADIVARRPANIESSAASAAGARQGVIESDARIKNLGAEFNRLLEVTKGQSISNEQAVKMNRMLLEMQSYLNTLKKAEIPEAKVHARIWQNNLDALGSASRFGPEVEKKVEDLKRSLKNFWDNVSMKIGDAVDYAKEH